MHNFDITKYFLEKMCFYLSIYINNDVFIVNYGN